MKLTTRTHITLKLNNAEALLLESALDYNWLRNTTNPAVKDPIIQFGRDMREQLRQAAHHPEVREFNR